MSGAVFIVAGQMSLKATWSSRPQPSNIGFTFDLKRGWFVIGVPDLSTGRRCSVKAGDTVSSQWSYAVQRLASFHRFVFAFGTGVRFCASVGAALGSSRTTSLAFLSSRRP